LAGRGGVSYDLGGENPSGAGVLQRERPVSRTQTLDRKGLTVRGLATKRKTELGRATEEKIKKPRFLATARCRVMEK